MTSPTPTRWREANRGTAIKETPKGILYLEFNERRVTALRPDPATAWVKHRDLSAWRGTAMPDISLGDLIRQIHAAKLIRGGVLRKDIPEDERPPARPYETRRRENFARFLEHVPTDVEVELAHRYPSRDWQLYRLLLASPEARDACTAGERSFVYALTQARRLLPSPLQHRVAFARRWLRRPRRHALARLGFPNRPLSVAVVQKLVPEHADAEVLRVLRSALHDDAQAKILAHLPRINAAVVLLLPPGLRERLTPAFLASEALIPHRWDAVDAHRTLSDTLYLEEQLGMTSRPRFATREALQAYHDMLVELARRNRMTTTTTPFPPPPVRLTKEERSWVIPLGNGRALVEEGTEMQHCLGTLDEHHSLARQGRFFAWRLVGKERATVALVQREGVWRLYDVRGFGNSRVSEELLRWATALLRRAQASMLTNANGQETLPLEAAPC